VDEMLAGMSSRTLTEWMAYYQVEPFGDELIDIHFATLDAIMTNSKDKKSDPKKFRLWRVDAEENFDARAFFDGLKELARKK
jgi:hypothetical protein